MVEMIHKREASWEGLPFTSMTAVASVVAEFDEIVKEAMPDPPREVKAQASYSHGSTGWLTGDELRDAASDLPPLEEIERVYIGAAFVDEDGSKEKSDCSGFRASIYLSGGSWVSTALGVEGRKLTAVEGVFAATKAAIDRCEKQKQDVEEEVELQEAARERSTEPEVATSEAEADHRPDPDLRPTPVIRRKDEIQSSGDIHGEGQVTTATASKLRKFAYDPWTVTVGGGIIVAVLVVLVTQT